MARAKKSTGKDPSYRTMKADYYPVQRTINLGTASAGTKYAVDVARVLSSMNHRLYRQGKTYQVKLDIENRADSNLNPAQYTVWALVDTWYIQKAWQLARSTYITATADERNVMSAQKIARWEDFRVGPGIPGAVTVHPYRYDATPSGAADTAGEFASSEITSADGTTSRTFTWSSSPSASEWSMLQEYDRSGATDGKPSAIEASNPYAGTDPGVHENQMDDLANKGNLPPYDKDNFNSKIWVKVATLDNSGAGNSGFTADSRMSTGYFNAPCGLLMVVPSISHTLTGDLTLTVKAGNYKGVAAMNMGA